MNSYFPQNMNIPPLLGHFCWIIGRVATNKISPHIGPTATKLLRLALDAFVWAPSFVSLATSPRKKIYTDNLNVALDGLFFGIACSSTIQILNLEEMLTAQAIEPQTGPNPDTYVNLNRQYSEGKASPVIGRRKEIDRLIDILSCTKKGNPVLIGEAGVGKTAIVEGLAQAIVRGDVPDALKNKWILSLNVNNLVAEARYVGVFEKKCKDLFAMLEKRGDCIVFIDELHNIRGLGSYHNHPGDLAEILKPILARGKLPFIGATTIDEYRTHIQKDPALDRRFHAIEINPPTKEEMREILIGVGGSLSRKHNCHITYAAIDEAIALSARYFPDKKFPDKPIELLDLAGAKHSGAKHQNSEEKITATAIRQIVAEQQGLPLDFLNMSEKQKILSLEERLNRQVIDQKEAISLLSHALCRNSAGIRDPNRPIGAFLCIGPPGVGKTHLAKILAKEMYGNPNALIQINMSEYMEKYSVASMIGIDGGQLTEAVRRRPFSVVLLDEIEKAHPDVLNLFLQTIEEGTLTTSLGKKIDFTNTIILMTSNLPPSHVSAALRPELLNRLDACIPFNHLSPGALKKVLILELDKLRTRLAEQKITLAIDVAVLDHLAEIVAAQPGGTRVLRRTLEKLIEDPLAMQILHNTKPGPQTYCASLAEDKLQIEIVR